MSKIIKLTESDLKRIVQRVIQEQTEPKTLYNAATGILPTGASAGALSGILSIINGGGPASQKVKTIVSKCSTSNYPITARTNKIADNVYNAIAGLGTDESAVYRALRTPTTLDEFCGVVKSYKSSYSQDLYSALDGDFDSESEWVQIMRPLRDVSLKSQQLANTKKSTPQGQGSVPTKTGQGVRPTQPSVGPTKTGQGVRPTQPSVGPTKPGQSVRPTPQTKRPPQGQIPRPIK